MVSYVVWKNVAVTFEMQLWDSFLHTCLKIDVEFRFNL